jgi:hypothetical protein
VLEHDLELTPPQIAERMGDGNHRAGADTFPNGSVAAALETVCYAGPHIFAGGGAPPGIGASFAFGATPKDAITPVNDLQLIGCGFGTVPGTVKLTLVPSGQDFDLPLAPELVEGSPWTNFNIWLKIPLITGVMDQTALITVTDGTNRVGKVNHPFIAAREEVTIFDSEAHKDQITVNPECFTAATEDSCGGAPPGDTRFTPPDGRTFVGAHLKSCCRSTDGIDVYSITLKNGWTGAELAPFVLKSESAFVRSQGGFTTCWWFGNKAGWAGYFGAVPSSTPDHTFEIRFIWHTDSVCSGAHYDANLVIVGPMGVPFW